MLYISIGDCIRANGDRHLERAIAYASAGYPERFFQGSMKKALRNYKNADALKIDDPLIKHITDAISVNITAILMRGHAK